MIRMPTGTSVTLLRRLQTTPCSQDWELLVEFCEPFIRGQFRRIGVAAQDLDDVSSEVMTAIFRSIGTFRHLGAGSFRAWVRRIAANHVCALYRKNDRQVTLGAGNSQILLTALEDPESDLSRQWDQEHLHHCLRRMLDRVRSEFSPDACRAFERYGIEDADPEEVAAELGISVAVVYLHKSRILNRLRNLRQELSELLE